METIPQNAKRSLIERLNFAYEPLVGSFSVPVFGALSTLGILGAALDWWGRLIDLGAPLKYLFFVVVAVYVVVTIWAARSVFLVAERCGMAESQRNAAKNKINDHVEAHCCLHDMIHLTRDSLLAAANFAKLVDLDDDASSKVLWDTWSSQLAFLQRAMRALTNSDCHVCIKAIIAGSGPDKGDGLMTICYGPAVSQERRQNSLVLPLNQGIANEAIVTHKIAHSNDILTDDRFWPKCDRERHSKTYRTLVSSPIFVNGRPEGVLCLDWKDPDKYQANLHANVIASFTDMMSTACHLHRLSRIIREQSS